MGVDRKPLQLVMKAFFQILDYKSHIDPMTKWIGINIAQTSFDVIFKHHLSTYRNNFITGISFGILPPNKKRQKRDWNLASFGKNLLNSMKYQVVRRAFPYFNLLRRIFKKIRSWL
ncbi:MAG: hypothetical protein HYZ48_04140 [Chlamydiales bacterium]|nr:hypothetical protein [Chlamydiales bacterium]